MVHVGNEIVLAADSREDWLTALFNADMVLLGPVYEGVYVHFTDIRRCTLGFVFSWLLFNQFYSVGVKFSH